MSAKLRLSLPSTFKKIGGKEDALYAPESSGDLVQPSNLDMDAVGVAIINMRAVRCERIQNVE